LSSINARNNPYLFILISLVFFGLVSDGCNKSTYQQDESLEFDIMERATVYVENGEYEKAGLIYEQFIIKFTSHAYVDDAAYRFAYLHVLADDRNPYFDYKEATLLFEKFIETYPNSRYIMACKNGLNLLMSITPAPVDPVVIRVKEDADPTVLNRIKAEIKTLQLENARLKQTLDELQRAIER